MGYSFNKICSSVIPAGTYECQISDIKFKTNPDGSMSNNMEVHYIITKGTYAKRTLIDTIYEKAFSFRLKPFLKAVGVDMAREFSSAKELYDYGIREAKGKTLILEVSTRTYNGNEYNDVKSFSALPSSSTSADEVLNAFGMSPEVMPSTPKMTDIPEDVSDIDAPQLSIDTDDLLF